MQAQYGNATVSRVIDIDPFALPLRLQTTGRANVRDGPGANYKVLFTLEGGAAIVGYSYVDQWVRVKDDNDRSGWIHQTLIGRREK